MLKPHRGKRSLQKYGNMLLANPLKRRIRIFFCPAQNFLFQPSNTGTNPALHGKKSLVKDKKIRRSK